ncbi:MAG TPA: hypothetical protein VHG08_04465, partial [Longimicrobium sp.]|nr:hypothetical protein [Longimicrobium sp.]
HEGVCGHGRGELARSPEVVPPKERGARPAAVPVLPLQQEAGDRSCARIAGLLLEREDGDGGWPGSAFFRGYHFWGSGELTTAVAAHALMAYAAGR